MLRREGHSCCEGPAGASLTSATEEQGVTPATSWGSTSVGCRDYATQHALCAAGTTPPRMLRATRSALTAHNSYWHPREPFLGNVPLSLENDHCGTWIPGIFFLKPRSQNMYRVPCEASRPAVTPSLILQPRRLHSPVAPAATSASGAGPPPDRRI